MRFLAHTLICCGLIVAFLSLPAHAQQDVVLTPPGAAPAAKENPKVASYGFGFQFGMSLSASGITSQDVVAQELLKGIMDAIAGKEPNVKQEEVQAAMQALGQKIMARKEAANKKFLAENKAKDGWQTTQSGLQYKVIKKGTGAAPTAASQVTVHYEGKLINGQVFDSSIQRGQPATFGVSQVIKGWTEALLRMKVGDKWQLAIPPELAYGAQGSPPVIGPNEVLLFDVELLEAK